MRPIPTAVPGTLLLAGACAWLPATAGPDQSSVWIEASRKPGVVFNGHRLPRESEGMGVVTGPEREIATAAHVVWRAESITITDLDGEAARARIVCIDAAADIALLRAERPSEHFASIRARPAVTGELVSVVERPQQQGEAPNVASGAIGATRWTVNGMPVPLIFSGIKGEKGMSGGGLFDAEGALLGIVVRIDGSLGYLSALPVTELCKRFARCAGGEPAAALPTPACAPPPSAPSQPTLPAVARAPADRPAAPASRCRASAPAGRGCG
ncbi:S1 family peptidase [Methylibium rhizosphaerae]|uniref:S1 family peptidase n=1 Tax=Methylibium rhizosphaerae TaxID=2570323 RepID=UPI0015E39CD2|nr:serine protease [Methylibium rhizosphaerae]